MVLPRPLCSSHTSVRPECVHSAMRRRRRAVCSKYVWELFQQDPDKANARFDSQCLFLKSKAKYVEVAKKDESVEGAVAGSQELEDARLGGRKLKHRILSLGEKGLER
eukprot:Gregarina_sp_Poly_1__7775@NODE_43_length_18077_cov_117_559078_g37_i0_p20_GENE_NODE_43_length_18077_cov_117_559078_g37_i0NODE_43_length_18077_cov_117_559078_g37_i0_p20_ORF_typecomplete_len108_score11_96_NODE_43_length_18077_cov_117_559078_g37_i024222745